MSWFRSRRYIDPPVDPESFDPEAEYTPKELEAYATAMLRQDARENKDEDTGILFEDHLSNRRKREVYAASGTVDDSLTGIGQKKPGVFAGDGQAFYNRTHPQGRKVNSDEQRRKHGASYYKN